MIRLLEYQGIPTFDAPDGIFRAWYFEPFVAVLSFFVWIQVWWRAERMRGLSRINRIDDALADPFGFSILSVLSYCAGIFLWKMFVPPAASHIPDGIPTSPLELAYLMVEVASGIVQYDFVFFFIHWAMHEIPFLRRLHHHHHAMPAGTVEARDVVHHSLADGALQVLVNILVQRHTPWGVAKSRVARLLHNIIVTSMLTESHSASPTPNVWRRWFVGVREHRLHHSYDHSSRATWLAGEVAATANGNEEAPMLQQKQRQQRQRQRKFDRHQQFFGYLDDLRFLYQEWRIRTCVRSVKQAA